MKAVLTIAGSDSSGGAGIQADIKTICAHGLFAESAITAITAQNTRGVFGVENIDPELVEQQIDVVFNDIRPDAVKVGMVSTPEIVRAICVSLKKNGAKNIVVDPVMVATSGSKLISDDAIDTLIGELLPLADVVTPNLPEAELLSDMEILDEDDMVKAAGMITGRLLDDASDDDHIHVPAILIKGGHSVSDPDSSNDLLRLPDGEYMWLRGPRFDNPNTHGTGCTLSSAIACGLAKGMNITDAVRSAKEYVAGAIAAMLNLGEGSGPLNHMWEYEDLVLDEF